MARDKYIIRRAKLEDYEGIKKMSGCDIYLGLDYIVKVYEQWAMWNSEDTSNRHCMSRVVHQFLIQLTRLIKFSIKIVVLVDTENDEIIGYQSLLFQHEGRYVLIQALRINPRLQGKGLGKVFEIQINRYLKGISPRVKVMKNIYTPFFPSSALESMLKESELISRRSMQWIYFEPNQQVDVFHQENLNGSQDGPIEIKEDTFIRLVKTNAKIRSICLDKDFLCLEFLNLYYSDVDKISQCGILHSYAVDNLEQAQSISIMSEPFQSSGNIFRSSIDIFALDIESAKRHLAHHIPKLKSIKVRPLVVFISVSSSLGHQFNELLRQDLGQKNFIDIDDAKSLPESLYVLIDSK